jgi:hypothetical protein
MCVYLIMLVVEYSSSSAAALNEALSNAVVFTPSTFGSLLTYTYSIVQQRVAQMSICARETVEVTAARALLFKYIHAASALL